MVEKETQVRMIGYGGMLMESFVAIMALAAAVSLSPGIYFSMNTSTATMNKLAGPETVRGPSQDHRRPRAPLREARRGRRGQPRRHDAQGRKPTPEWDSWDDNGNPKTYTGAEALERLASDVGEPNVVSRTGGAPTLSVGIAHILHQIGGGRP